MPSHYPYLLDPTAYPDYARRPFPVPTWATFEHTTQFTTLRAFAEQEGRLVGYREELDRYVDQFGLGRVIWPVIHTLQAENVKDLVAEMKRRRLYLFDLWGHVPGSGTEGFWSHITPPPGMVDYLRGELGDRFLGIDNGEQDGRYIGGYAPQQCPSSASRREQYLNFHRHFQRLGDDLGNHLSALVSLCFGHYFLKEGNHALLGAETAQALPNSQVYYAFIRGAGKQYGVHWFGNASVWNRWGWKNYGGEGQEGGLRWGPEQGTSINLLKRLLYTHYLYNCVAVGFENGWIGPENKLTPIGQVQAAAARLVAEHGQPGVMHTPAALLLDYYAGWAMPRHLYTGSIYQVWGGAPYQEGDYLTHGVLSLLYPGYEDASYYRDERGFLAPTPHGDIADCLLSDAPAWVLRQYGLVVAAGRLEMGRELQDKLREYVQGGGHLVVTAGNAGLVPGLELGAPQRVGGGARVRWRDGQVDREAQAFDLAAARLPAGAQVLATCGACPAVVRITAGRGAYTVLLSPFGLNAQPLVSGRIPNREESPLPSPYLLLAHVRRALQEAFTSQQLFAVSEGLSLITCRQGRGRYLLGVHNNGLQARPLQISSRCGPLVSISELPLDRSEQGQPGYWPTGFAGNDGGRSDEHSIAGGDMRLFAVRVQEREVRVLPRAVPSPRPQGRLLALRGRESIQEQILARPSFFQHFEGVKVDWTYLRDRDAGQLERERGWLERQRVRLMVDFSPGLNFYPDLNLLDNLAPRYQESKAAMDDVLAKMERLGAREAVICLHRIPENQCDGERAAALFLSGVRDLCARAGPRGITLYLQAHPHKWLGGKTAGVIEFIAQVGAPNLRFALNTGHAAMSGEAVAEAWQAAGERLGLVLLCAPGRDLFDQAYDSHAPLAGSGLDLGPVRGSAVGQVLDGDYQDQDQEYLDCLAAWH